MLLLPKPTVSSQIKRVLHFQICDRRYTAKSDKNSNIGSTVANLLHHSIFPLPAISSWIKRVIACACTPHHSAIKAYLVVAIAQQVQGGRVGLCCLHFSHCLHVSSRTKQPLAQRRVPRSTPP